MNSFFVLFLPSVLGIKMYMYLIDDKQINLSKKALTYLSFVLISNYVCVGIDLIINHFYGNLLDYINNNILFAFKYLTLSIIINGIIAFLSVIVKKYISISIEVKQNEKNR